jgi:lipopolysaccharide/colanic/teichoic acid biosynthesis glycosyltransferase
LHGLRHHPRHLVRPGLTGAWQITHRATGRPLHQCFNDDLPYLRDISLRYDLWVLCKTGRVVLEATGS